MSEPDRSALLLFDGTCGFCANTVQFVLRHERARRTLRFASLQSPAGTAVRVQHPELNDVDSVIWYEAGSGGGDERLLTRSAAALRVLEYLGGAWRPLAWLGAIVPRPARDVVYDVIARHRHQIVRGAPVCLVPSPEQRARFIDWDVAT
ncbi:MAG: DCC1-like thiol-disulfide oxidoreductase family protein [bacterium]